MQAPENRAAVKNLRRRFWHLPDVRAKSSMILTPCAGLRSAEIAAFDQNYVAISLSGHRIAE
jgi:hypothetical protein